MGFAEDLKHLKGKAPKISKEPVWKGPAVDGVTKSLLDRYLSDGERFRIYTIEGLSAIDRFEAPLEFGNMWHVCEESGDLWKPKLLDYCKKLCGLYSIAQDNVSHWYTICSTMFPLYLDYWKHHPDMKNGKPLFREKVFKVEYQLPSGRSVFLKGKFDGTDLIKEEKSSAIYLLEHKTKGSIDQHQLIRQLSFDLQTMFYLVALHIYRSSNDLPEGFEGEMPIAGVRYNVIKRPAQYQGKKETRADFAQRLSGIIGASPNEFFMRWKVEVSSDDISKFRRECLDPLLENLLDDYEWWTYCKEKGKDPFNYKEREKIKGGYHQARHFRRPYGIYNLMDRGGVTDLDHYLATGSELGLRRVENFFPELEE